MDTTNRTKKNIVVFVPRFPVLTETFIARDLARLTKNENISLTVLAMQSGDGVVYSELKDKLVVSRLGLVESAFGLMYMLLHPKKAFLAYKLVLRDTTKSLLQRKYLFLKSFGYIHTFARCSPDEIHAHFLSDPSTIAMVAALVLNVPFSINAHARDVTEYPTLAYEKIKRAKFVSVCNTHAYNEAVKLAKENSSKVKLIRHGVDENFIFSTPVELEKPTRPLIISGGTRLVEKKGLNYLILASEILTKRGISHEVHITGPGDQYTALTSLIKEKKLEDTVFIHGEGKGVPFTLISQYYRVADVMVLPSLALKSGDADGIPNALIEASLAKLAIVTTNAGSIEELITTDVNGVIVPQKNAEAIATEVEKLIFDPERRKQLGEAAYIKAKEMFDLNKNVSMLAEQLLI